MEDPHCPSYSSCHLVKDENSITDNKVRLSYLNNYCKSDKREWVNCKRLICKNELNFCPDFVLPDMELSTNEIIDKFDNENY